MEVAVTVGLLLLLLAIGAPVAISIFLPSIFALFFFLGGVSALPTVGQVVFAGLQSHSLIAVPLFILMGHLMVRSGAAHDLFELVSVWLRHLPGGLAVAAVGGSALFACICGSSGATAATIGVVSLDQMYKRGYPQDLATGTIAASGTLGILIPPSIPLLLYAIVTDESPGQLFMAGVIPGIVSALVYMMYVSLHVKYRRSIKLVPRASWAERWATTRASLSSLSVIPLVLGGIYLGWFTATEAAAVGLGYVLLVGCFVKRTLTIDGLSQATGEATRTIAMIMLIIIASTLLGHVVIRLGLSDALGDLIGYMNLSPFALLCLLIFLFIVLGIVLEPAPIILIAMPIVYPIIKDAGINNIWFAIILVKTLEVALISPPVGTNLFVIQSISPGLKTAVLMRGVLPFLMLEFLLIALLIAFPQLSLWLPQMMR